MNRLSRSTALKIAAVLSFLGGVFGIIFSLPMIAQGATAVNQGGEAPPYFVLCLGHPRRSRHRCRLRLLEADALGRHLDDHRKSA